MTLNALYGLLFLLLLPAVSIAQGTGPQTNFLTPVGVKGIAFTYLNGNTNFRFGQTNIGEADIDTHTAAVNYNYRFSLFERFAMINVGGSYQSLSSDTVIPPGPASNVAATGTQKRYGATDPSASIRVGLMGAPALTPKQWLEHQKGFQMYALAELRAPYGSYDSTSILNPGFNRWSYGVGLPMVVPLERTRRKTFLEITPEILWFGDNREPLRQDITRISQNPLYLLEIHASHHLSGKFWMSLGFQYQNGGQTFADGVPDDNKFDQWFAELGIGYIFNRNIALVASYGEIIHAANSARGYVWRVRTAIAF
jgi:hypothetical protein